MNNLEGYRTIIVMAIGLLAGILAQFGIVITMEEQAAWVLVVMSAIGIVMRLVTTKPVGSKVNLLKKS